MYDFIGMLIVAGMTMLTLRWLLVWSKAPLNQQAIRQLLVERLLAAGTPTTLLTEAEGELTLRIGEQHCTIRLDALYRRCAEFPFRTLLYIRQAVDAVRVAAEQPVALPDGWETRVMPLLLPAQSATPPELCTASLLPALSVGYALVEPEAFRWITEQDLAGTETTPEALQALARRNLERSCSDLVIDAQPGEGADHVIGFQTGDGLDAARVLIPSFHARFSPRFDGADLLVAIPTRDTLVIVAATDPQQAAVLDWRTRHEFRQSAYRLLDHVLLVTEHGIGEAAAEETPVEADAG